MLLSTTTQMLRMERQTWVAAQSLRCPLDHDQRGRCSTSLMSEPPQDKEMCGRADRKLHRDPSVGGPFHPLIAMILQLPRIVRSCRASRFYESECWCSLLYWGVQAKAKGETRDALDTSNSLISSASPASNPENERATSLSKRSSQIFRLVRSIQQITMLSP